MFSDKVAAAVFLTPSSPTLCTSGRMLSSRKDDGFGSVTRVFIVCMKDKLITEEFQRWMIRNSGIENVAEIGGADHMAMLGHGGALPMPPCYSQ
ncbi:hypothetical protein SAY86_022832 [Trapa natans]|uniref:Uncharacterized protein n=1 Tax=Trapa natans TaxID=22666 RepID=A0AAN7M5Z0_TRANT|nr:hypothetical protein SAY86_022832 [Trapa natans]